MLRIRQIVFAARDLESTVEQFVQALGLQVAYRDPLVGEFGLHNAILPVGDQFLEVVSPVRPDTAAGRHLDRHGDSAYMLIFQTDDLTRDKARLSQLGVRVVLETEYPDIRTVHLHPKDIGAAIVSIDQATPPESWRWAGPDWQKYVAANGAQRVIDCTIGATDPDALAQRWARVLGTATPQAGRIGIDGGSLLFEKATRDLIQGYSIKSSAPQPTASELRICGTRFQWC